MQAQSDKSTKEIRDRLVELMKKGAEEENDQWIAEMNRAKGSLANLNEAEQQTLGAKQLLSAADKRINDAEERIQKNKAASSINVVPGEYSQYNISGSEF